MKKKVSSQTRKRRKDIVFYTILVIVLFFTLFPLLWMILASFKTNAQLLNMENLLVLSRP